MTSIISPDNHLAIWAILLALASLGLWLEGTIVGRKFSGVLTAMILGGVLSNAGVLPVSAPSYDQVWSFLVPLAIPLFLLKANLPEIVRQTGRMLVAFGVAVVGTVVGVVVAFLLVPVAEPETSVGLLSASYIGGGINFAAMSVSLGVSDSGFLATVAAADNIVGAMYIALLAALPAFALVRRFIPLEAQLDRAGEPSARYDDSPPDAKGIAAAVAISAAICAVSYAIADTLGLSSYRILFISAITLLIANTAAPLVRKVSGEFEIGLIFMYVFLITLGAQADVRTVIDSGLSILWFVLVLVAVHFLIVMLGARLLRIGLADAIIASNACAAGPTTAIALSAARGWHSKTTPGLMCGILGYAIANFIALSLVRMLT